ncbi:SIMPL domain-containing protein [Hydrogenophaga pseudoflava]|uniref:SIMPL domain-containing protein n=1 Tax=Hydrogenophaga pseudoflava TaxID=47421 RepID=UPI0027E5ADD3|nr:SIMPL domain-containing protein [Hydrogenophaga pseudoflava]MDQ7746557.1 SIMPL domain-containing protein [Hydrogenophaga pseudoflava]
MTNNQRVAPARRRAGVFALSLSGLLVTSTLSAQPMPAGAPLNVVVVSASAQREVTQDWLTMTLTTSRDGSDAAAVQSQLRQAIEAALAIAKPQASAQQLEVKTGSFGVYPRHGSNGRISGWQGSAELVLEGRDFVRISTTAGKMTPMVVGNVAFSLSREAQQKLESEVQASAIERFKSKAGEVAKAFGFEGYSLREVSVSPADQGERPMYRMRAESTVAASSDAPVPVEAGKSLLTVTVSGSVQLR